MFRFIASASMVDGREETVRLKPIDRNEKNSVAERGIEKGRRRKRVGKKVKVWFAWTE